MKIILFSMILLSVLLSSSLEDMLKELQTTPKEQRYKLVNDIKRELVKLNSEQRAQALQALQKSLKAKNGSFIKETSQKTELKQQKDIMLKNEMFEHKIQNNDSLKQVEHNTHDTDKGSKNKRYGR